MIRSETSAKCALVTLWPNAYISSCGFEVESCVASSLERLDLEQMFYGFSWNNTV